MKRLVAVPLLVFLSTCQAPTGEMTPEQMAEIESAVKRATVLHRLGGGPGPGGR